MLSVDMSSRFDLMVGSVGFPTSPPAALVWDANYPLTVAKSGNAYDVGHAPRDLVDPLIWTGPAFHVDLAVGEDSYSGLGATDGDFTNAKRTIHAAFTEGNLTGAPYRVLVKSGECGESAFSKNGNVEPTQPVAVIGWGGPVLYRTGPLSVNWVLDQGTTYTASISLGNRVFRTDMLDAFGNYTELDEAASVADCRSTIGTWFNDSGSVHVNIGTQPGTRDIAALRNFHGARFLNHSDDLYLENIHTEGGITGALHCQATAARNIVAVDCSFRYSSPSNTGSQLDSVNISRTTGLVAMFNVNASYGAKDGFNFHEVNDGEMSVLLVNCVSHYNGKFGASSVNAVTTHEGIRAAVIGGDFGNSRGGAVVHTIEQTKTWIVDARITARDPVGNAIAFKCSANSIMYLEGTSADAAGSGINYAIEANGGDVFKRRHTNINGTETAYSGGSIQTF